MLSPPAPFSATPAHASTATDRAGYQRAVPHSESSVARHTGRGHTPLSSLAPTRRQTCPSAAAAREPHTAWGKTAGLQRPQCKPAVHETVLIISVPLALLRSQVVGVRVDLHRLGSPTSAAQSHTIEARAQERERMLSEPELRCVWQGCDGSPLVPHQYGQLAVQQHTAGQQQVTYHTAGSTVSVTKTIY